MPVTGYDIEFSHAFQPIVDAADKKVVAYEMLLRGPKGEPPSSVFQRLPKPQLLEFDQFSREKAIALAVGLGLEVNLHLNFTPGAILFKQGSYLQQTLDVIRQHNLPLSRLTLELTESEVIDNVAELWMILNRFRRTGITIAIDDFGAGYAGLNLLADMLPDMIKLDMHLIRGIDENGPRQSIVRAICSVCLDLGIEVLAEGVETQAEYEFLRQLEIDLFQGFYFSRPGFESLPTQVTLT